MALPWELDNERAQIMRELGGYVLAMRRAKRWDGGSLSRRRRRMRELADRCGWQLQLELVLKQLERQHAAAPGDHTRAPTEEEKREAEMVIAAAKLMAQRAALPSGTRRPR